MANLKVSAEKARTLVLEGQGSDGLQVSGWLDLSGCTGLTSLPDGLQVSGGLYLSGCTGLTSLPDGLQVSGGLDLSGCTGLTSLPDGLVTDTLIYSAPAPYLTGDFKCRTARPSDEDRGYWEGVLDLTLTGCYDDIYRAISRSKKQLLEKPGLEEWQLAAIRRFRG